MYMSDRVTHNQITRSQLYLKYNFPNSVFYDFLKSDILVRIAKNPHILMEEILAFSEEVLTYPIVIEEVQKIPEVLNEI